MTMKSSQIVLLGSDSVGKTSIIIRYIENTFHFNYLSTIGIDFKTKIIKMENGEQIKLIITDTPGQERINSINKNYCHMAHGIIIVYDITRSDSFKDARNWIYYIRNNISTKVPILLVGNKIDIEEHRNVSIEEGKNMAEEHELIFLECSARTWANVDSIFQKLADTIYKNYHNYVEKRKEHKAYNGLYEEILKSKKIVKINLNKLNKYISFWYNLLF